MSRSLSLIVCVLAISYSANAFRSDSTSGHGGNVKGNGYEFELKAPKGWVLDLASGASSGMVAQLYPDRSSFNTSPTVMFVTVVSKKTPGSETVSKLSTTNVNDAKKAMPNIMITRSDSLATNDGKKAYVRNFGAAQFQSVAYVDEDSSIVVFILRSNAKNRFDNARYSFKDLIGSYSWAMKKPE